MTAVIVALIALATLAAVHGFRQTEIRLIAGAPALLVLAYLFSPRLHVDESTVRIRFPLRSGRSVDRRDALLKASTCGMMITLYSTRVFFCLQIVLPFTRGAVDEALAGLADVPWLQHRASVRRAFRILGIAAVILILGSAL